MLYGMRPSGRARAARSAHRLLTRSGAELHDARVGAGLRLVDVAGAAGISASELSRIERGLAPRVPLDTLARVAAAVGLDLWMRSYPAGNPLRDAAQVGLERAFLDRVGPGLRRAHEVPIGDGRDQRAWDMTLTDPTARERAGVEFDTRLADAQAYLRRMTLKRRDGAVDRLVLVVADTRSNRAAVTAARTLLDGIDIEPTDAWTALGAGRIPRRDCLLFVPLPRGVPRGRP